MKEISYESPESENNTLTCSAINDKTGVMNVVKMIEQAGIFTRNPVAHRNTYNASRTRTDVAESLVEVFEGNSGN